MRKKIMLLSPFILCSCLPEVNAPQLSELPVIEKRHDKTQVEALKQKREQDLEQIETQREELLKEEN